MRRKECRRGKQREFETMLSNELLDTPACPVWERTEYRFVFAHSWEDLSFFWKGKRIHVTSCEALHLYQRLVLGKKPSACTSRLALYGMRKKFGSPFLREYLPAQEQMGGDPQSMMKIIIRGEVSPYAPAYGPPLPP